MATYSPEITVLIPTYNRAEFLVECLDSILKQTLPASQVLVINDGSTDNTRSICDAYRGKIEYYELNQAGKPAALNFGLKKTTGDYVWIFDDDDVAFPDALARFVEPLARNPEYGFSYSTFFYTASDTKTGRIGDAISELKIPDLQTRGFLIPLLEWNFLGGAALFARTECYKAVGDFDPELIRSQDYEMAIRIARRFKGIRVTGPPTFHYRQHAGMRGTTRDRFPEDARLPKWFSYNQKFFRKLYRQIPLEEYLPPGSGKDKLRQALLQRIAVMSDKLLMDEVINDLRQLAQYDDRSPFSPEEYVIVREMMAKSSYHRTGTIFERLKFFREIRRLAASRAGIRLLREKMTRALLARYRDHPAAHLLPGIFYRIVRLYI